MSYPYQARTNKSTHLIILGGDNLVVQAGTSVTVYGEDGAFGTVSIKVSGEEKFGTMLRADYDAV
jgi:VCBS repeat-containing protein